MTQELQAVFAAAAQLPDEEQDALAAVITQEMNAERRWGELFASPESEDLLARLADTAIADHRGGRSRKFDLSEM